MNFLGSKWWLGMVIGVVVCPLAFAAPPRSTASLEQRIERIEKLTASRALLDMNSQLQLLQSEVRQLRGQVEEITFELERRSATPAAQPAGTIASTPADTPDYRLLFNDLDMRLSRLESLQQSASSSSAASVPVASTHSGMPPATAAAQFGAPAGSVAPAVAPATAATPATPAATATAATVPAAATQPKATAQSVPASAAQPAPAAPTQPGGESEVALYKSAFDHLKEGRYAQAELDFKWYLERFPNGTYADNAQYWLGESAYVVRDFLRARAGFETLITTYPKSAKIPDAWLKLGFINYEEANYPKARECLERVRKDYSASHAASLARQRLERMTREGR